jgi:FMN reductase
MSGPKRTRPVVVGLGGSLRANSSSARALAGALAAAESAGAETVLLDSGHLNLPPYDPAAPSEQGDRLVAEARRADGVIIASPGYHGGPSGLIKNALDYLEELRDDDRPYLEGRPVGCIACASGWQATTTTLMSLRSVVHALRGWPTPLGVAINSLATPFGSDGTIPEPVYEQLEILGRQVAEFALLMNRYGG